MSTTATLNHPSRFARSLALDAGRVKEHAPLGALLVLTAGLYLWGLSRNGFANQIRADVARRLLPEIEDDGWFFDTELLVSAQQRGLRIHEVAVDWEEDPDSRVDIVQTALGDLRGVCRLCLARPLARFVLIGALSTIAYAAMYLVLRMWLGPDGANALALACTAIANTQANRRYTFGVRGRVGLLTQHAAGVVVFLLALGLTGGALGVLHGLDPTAPHVLEVIVLVVASAFATITRYAVLRSWVFATRLRPASLRTRQGVPPRLLLARPHRRRR